MTMRKVFNDRNNFYYDKLFFINDEITAISSLEIYYDEENFPFVIIDFIPVKLEIYKSLIYKDFFPANDPKTGKNPDVGGGPPP